MTLEVHAGTVKGFVHVALIGAGVALAYAVLDKYVFPTVRKYLPIL